MPSDNPYYPYYRHETPTDHHIPDLPTQRGKDHPTPEKGQWNDTTGIPLSPKFISAVTPTVYGTDGESDSVPALMMKSRTPLLSKKMRKGKLARLKAQNLYQVIEAQEAPNPSHWSAGSPETTPVEPAESAMSAVPVAALNAAITSNTGFSPINPSAPLPEALGAPRHIEVTIPAPQIHESLSASSTLGIPSSVSIPQTPAVIRPSYREVRPQLFQDAFFESINGATFNDTQIHVFSARTRAGVAHTPRVLRARGTFLEAASTKFEEELYETCSIKNGAVNHRCSRVDYGYDGDSDLEDCEETEDRKAQEQNADFANNAQPVAIEGTEDEGSKRSPDASDTELISLDGCESESLLSELLQEAREEATEELDVEKDGFRSALCTPQHKPTLTLQTSTLATQEQRLYLPVDEAVEEQGQRKTAVVATSQTKSQLLVAVPDDNVPVVAQNIPKPEIVPTNDKSLIIRDSAHRTWQALLLYLYNDHLDFAPLRSQGKPAVADTRNKTSSHPLSGESYPKCSPKSMYRLADKLGLVELKQMSFEAIEDGLSEYNIVKELFSDFTWRYTDVLKMQTEIFYRHAAKPAVQAAMSETFQDIAYGQLPHSSVVLESLFKKFASASIGNESL